MAPVSATRDSPSRADVDSRPMEVQIFGIRKSADTRSALRFFAERRSRPIS
jgi:hypothetical protein